MTPTGKYAKLTLRTPVGAEKSWFDWQIVVDDSPVADFRKDSEVTLELPEGFHSLAIRRHVVGEWYSRSQIIHLDLSHQTPIVLEAGIDKRLYLLLLALLAGCFSKKLFDLVGLAAWFDWLMVPALLLILLTIFLMMAIGVDRRLSVISPQPCQVTKPFPGTVSGANLDIQQMADQYAQTLLDRKPQEGDLSALDLWSRRSRLPLILASVFLCSKPQPFYEFGLLAAAIFLVTIFVEGLLFTSECLLKIGSILVSIGGLIWCGIAAGPKLGGYAEPAFYLSAVIIGIGIALCSAAQVEKQWKISASFGSYTLVLYTLLGVVSLSIIFPALFQTAMQHK